MQDAADDPARRAVLEELQQAALAMYGEERSAESTLQAALEVAAAAIWRVGQERIQLLGPEPLPTHD